MNVKDAGYIAFRCYPQQSPKWEAYGINHAVYGSGDSLSETREDARQALGLHLDCNADDIYFTELHEHQVAVDTPDHPAVWVRTLHEESPRRDEFRREIREIIAETLVTDPQYYDVFAFGTASTGDIVATIALPDDLVSNLLAQVGGTDRLYVCLPSKQDLQWQCLSNEFAEGEPGDVTVASLGLSDAASVADFSRLRQLHRVPCSISCSRTPNPLQGSLAVLCCNAPKFCQVHFRALLPPMHRG
ncbi:hypothetical protein CGERO_00460 [Corynebacterium gerontici]|uniref:Uncharacterized protein n=1 Tax=Corynebacterium gerontici TaxID=2079234 RepID=A0A3G6J221_9CORY|nr:hypothetical protein CGERO_00460 [Corynebacterium gerontici]